VVVNDGKMIGGDTVISYPGSYVEDGNTFTASITTERHTAEQPSVFGIEEIGILPGSAKQAPGLVFVAD
jgi:hypothetical protein